MGSHNRVPLFINRFSLSPRTAIGVQTLRLIGPYQDWLHFHWWSNSLKQMDSRSVLFENTVLSRYSSLHNPKFLRLCERVGISSWVGSDLRPSLAKRLTEQYQSRVSSTYVAPLSESDATRCLELTNLVGAPFVLHLWDVLEGDVASGALRELIDRAERVFCVSEPLLHDVSLIRRDAELLTFSRDASAETAVAPGQGPLRVVMHGNISSYAEGLDDLDQAIALLDSRGMKVEISFLGSPKILRQAQTTIKKRVNVRGFCPTQQDLDRELGQAHVAFLPGPKLDPKHDLRSRYSIPSRVLDYMALGLPVVGTVHKASATGGFVRKLGLENAATCPGPEEIADWLMRLSNPDKWAEQSARSRDAFAYLERQEAPAQKLKRTMEKIS
jgi:glycosyltransferase involved in cell wall biosynthesis